MVYESHALSLARQGARCGRMMHSLAGPGGASVAQPMATRATSLPPPAGAGSATTTTTTTATKTKEPEDLAQRHASGGRVANTSAARPIHAGHNNHARCNTPGPNGVACSGVDRNDNGISDKEDRAIRGGAKP